MKTRNLGYFLVAALLASACAPKAVRKADDGSNKKTAQGAADKAQVPEIETTEASIRGGEFASVEGIEPIYFEYDSATLSPKALDALKANAESLKTHPTWEVLVAGFCDERGTVEYNLALGQKRAKEVREYYMRLGVPAKSVATISYGKEQQVCSESTDECWAKNRRAETRVRAATAAK
jgi:peptidoglycan-associated lipoprotein